MFWMYFILFITVVANLIIMYFMIVRPLQRENRSLREEMHQQINKNLTLERIAPRNAKERKTGPPPTLDAGGPGPRGGIKGGVNPSLGGM